MQKNITLSEEIDSEVSLYNRLRLPFGSLFYYFCARFCTLLSSPETLFLFLPLRGKVSEGR